MLRKTFVPASLWPVEGIDLFFESLETRRQAGLVISEEQAKEQMRKLEAIDRLWEARDLDAMWGDPGPW